MTEPTTAAGPTTPTGKAFAQSLMTDGQPGRVRRRPILEWIATIEAEARQQDASVLTRFIGFCESEVPYWRDLPGQADRWNVYVRLLADARAGLPPSAPAGLDEQKLRIAYEAGRLAAGFEETLARINATMTADTTEIAANLARLEQDHP